jgi:hypothetical protein
VVVLEWLKTSWDGNCDCFGGVKDIVGRQVCVVDLEGLKTSWAASVVDLEGLKTSWDGKCGCPGGVKDIVGRQVWLSWRG